MKKIGLIKSIPLIFGVACSNAQESNLESRVNTDSLVSAYNDSVSTHLDLAEKYLSLSINYADRADSLSLLQISSDNQQAISNKYFDQFGKELYTSLLFNMEIALQYGLNPNNDKLSYASDLIADVEKNLDVFNAVGINENDLNTLHAGVQLSYAMQLNKQLTYNGPNDLINQELRSVLETANNYLGKANNSHKNFFQEIYDSLK